MFHYLLGIFLLVQELHPTSFKKMKKYICNIKFTQSTLEHEGKISSNK